MNGNPDTQAGVSAPELISADDKRHIREVVDYITTGTVADAVADALPLDAPSELIELVAEVCELDHGSCLIFPRAVGAVMTHLREQGLIPEEPIASTVVRRRLADRYRIPAERLDAGDLRVQIIHAHISANAPRGIEVFCVDPDALPAPAMHNERMGRHETHIAVRLTDTGGNRLEQLRRALNRKGGPEPDGGGYNPDHGRRGSSVLYWRARGRTKRGWPRRLEIISDGHHAEVLKRHAANMIVRQPESHGRGDAAIGTAPTDTPLADTDDDEGRQLLHLLIGPWITQAVRAMVLLDIPDHLASGPLTCQDLSHRAGVDVGRLNRLLRALSHPWIGVLQPASGRTFRLTTLGRRLSRQAVGSMRHLALLYGGPFYLSFSALPEGIRDGVQPFEMVFGQTPFEYLAQDPGQGTIFTHAMAEGVAFIADVATVVDLSPARTIVDIGGGNGALLTHLLDTYPHLEGTLLERPEAIGAARVKLGLRGQLKRCKLLSRSFLSGELPADMHVYLLSRILHDWDDQTCATILRAVRAAAANDSTLLVIERPLPTDPAAASLAHLWDLNMLVNNVGGRERTRAEYRELLENAGFAVVDERQLPHDMTVTMACPAVSSPADPASSMPAGLYKYAR